MVERLLVLKLETDAIFTASGGSVGAPASLDHPTGASLLGAVAELLYGERHPHAFAAVQLGGLRFSDGLPIVDRAVAFPVPVSWHRLKVAPASSPGESTHFDCSHSRPQGAQLKQERDGWVLPGEGGQWQAYSVQPSRSLRTAISEEGRAREGLLYGFEAVRAGQQYLVQASADPALEGLLDTVLKSLCSRNLRLGRSRAAEFGRVSVKAAPPGLRWPSSGQAENKENKGVLRLLCLSDLALRDEQTGQPSLRPSPKALGLPDDWVLDVERSFLRTRRYSPWNGHRQRPDLERQVIQAGSVLTFNGAGTLPPDTAARLLAGVGDHQGAGLGRLCMNAAVLAAATLSLLKPRSAALNVGPLPVPNDGLGQWLAADLERSTRTEKSWTCAESLAVKARSWGVPTSQWGRLRSAAAAALLRGDTPADRQRLLAELRGLIEGVSVRAWGRGAGALFGKREQQRQAEVPARPHPQARAGVTPRREATPEQIVSWTGGALEEWSKDTSIHFARTVQILGRRAVRERDGAATASTEAPIPAGGGR